MSSALTPTDWLDALSSPSREFKKNLTQTYGDYPDEIAARVALIGRVLATHREVHGEDPVRLFRAPARINLRGMHIDTHGGYLNLMTHQREVVVAAAAAHDAQVHAAHADPAHRQVRCDLAPYAAYLPFGASWEHFIEAGDALAAGNAQANGDNWGSYVRGAALSLLHRLGEHPPGGMRCTVGGDIPVGAGLSSSAALCLALIYAQAAINGVDLPARDLILAARDAEWYTGSRCGLADQAAIVLGRRDAMVHLDIFPTSPDFSRARWVAWPKEYAILVIDSLTKRSLSGAQSAEYSRNRFGYSVALEILRQEMIRQGKDHAKVEYLDRLSRFHPTHIEPEELAGLLDSVPETVSLEDLAQRYHLSGVEERYRTYFGHLPTGQQPRAFPLRGPLTFGLAESERARIFPELIQHMRLEAAGALMTLGHEGDRVSGEWKNRPDLSMSHEASVTPLAAIPGCYGASTPVLDRLVDFALESGALGASLTGAGMGGVVLALCEAGKAQALCEKISIFVESPEYRDSLPTTTEESFKDAVLLNCPTSGLSELCYSRAP